MEVDSVTRPFCRKPIGESTTSNDYFRDLKEMSENQFYKLYMARLGQAKGDLKAKVEERSDVPLVPALLELHQYSGKVAILGTIFKDMSKKPAALKEFMDEDEHAVLKKGPHCYVSDDDMLVIEDETSRVKVILDNIDINYLYTGMVVAFIGEVTNQEFKASEMVIPGPAKGTPLPQQMCNSGEKRWVVMISDLQYSDYGHKNIALQMVSDWVEGYMGDQGDEDDGSKVVRMIIAGNTMSPNEADKMDDISLALRSRKQRKIDDDRASDMLKKVDSWIAGLCATIAVDIMPGETDPSNYYLPQQAFHSCLFPKASSHSTYRSVTNPFSGSIDGVEFLGVSGQNVTDQQMYGKHSNIPELMKQHIETRNICPTAPDTLGCFPFKEDDPFVLTSTPHVYFVGCQDKFETAQVDGPGYKVRLISVPSFSKTQEIVLLNIASPDFECHVMKFS